MWYQLGIFTTDSSQQKKLGHGVILQFLLASAILVSGL